MTLTSLISRVRSGPGGGELRTRTGTGAAPRAQAGPLLTHLLLPLGQAGLFPENTVSCRCSFLIRSVLTGLKKGRGGHFRQKALCGAPPRLALPPAASGAVCVYTVMVLSWWALGAIWSNSVPATTAAELLHVLRCCEDRSPVAVCGFLSWRLLLPSTGFRCVDFSNCVARACGCCAWAQGTGSVVVVGLGRSAAFGIFLDQGLSLFPSVRWVLYH